MRRAGRGRPHGEVLELMHQGALAAGHRPDQMTKIMDEFEAAETCLRMARPGDLVMILPTNIERAWAQVLAFRPTAPQPAATAQDTWSVAS